METNKITLSPKYKSLWKSNDRYYLVTGGRGSGKSFSVTLFLLTLTFEQNQIILFTRYTLTSAKTSIIPQFIEVMEVMGYGIEAFDVTNDVITNKKTGSKILFKGIKTSSGVQTAALKSLTGVTTWVLDEAEELTEQNTFEKIDLSVRVNHIQNRVILIMNPTTKEHWIYNRFFETGKSQNTTYIHTTYLDNKDNLNKSTLDEYDRIKKVNPDHYNHVVLGKWLDKAEGVIYTNWEIGEFPESMPYIYGLDFGVVDPDALVKVAIDTKNNIIYAKECLYQNNLSTSELYEILNNECGRRLIIGDAAAKRQILDFRRKNLNIRKCYKPKVVERIKLVKGFKLVVSGNNLVKELNNYHWLDKAGEYPVDNYNHILDALGYAVVELCKKRLGTL